jgi:hypothetical protein
MLPHESVLLYLSYHIPGIHSIRHAGSCTCAAVPLLLYTRDSKHSVMVIHQSLPLSLHYPIYEIHSICHADP